MKGGRKDGLLLMKVEERYSSSHVTRDIGGPEARIISIELQKQMVNEFEKALLDVQRQLSEVMAEVKQKGDLFVAAKEKLSNEHDKLFEKVTELSAEVMSRLTAEELNLALRKSQVETQSQVLSLGSKLEIAERALAVFQDQNMAVRDYQEVVSSLIDRLCLLENAQFVSLDVPAGIASVKGIVSRLQEEQASKEAEVAGWQENLRDLERLLLINSDRIEEVSAEIEKRARREDMGGVVEEVLSIVEKASKQLQDRVNALFFEQNTLESKVGSLQEDLKLFKDELKSGIEEMTSKLLVLERKQQSLMAQDVSTELSKMKEELTALQDQFMRELDCQARKEEVHDIVQKVGLIDGENQRLQSRVEALGMAHERNEANVRLLQDKWSNLGQELKVHMENELLQLEGAQKSFVTEYVITELSKVKDDAIALHEELSAKVDRRASKQELSDVVTKVEDMVSMLEVIQKRSVAENVITEELLKVKVNVIALQEKIMETRTSKQEFSDVVKKVEDMVSTKLKIMGERFVTEVVTELSKVKDKVTALKEELSVEVERRASKEELSEVLTKVADMVSTKLEAVQGTSVTEDVVRQMKVELMAVQEEWRQQQALMEAVPQELAMGDDDDDDDERLDLLKRVVREEGEAHRQLLLDEVRSLVAELLEASKVSPSTNVLNDPIKSTTSLEERVGDVLSVGEHETIPHTQDIQFPDKRTAFLETFFAVMGQLIRQELEKMNAASGAQTPVMPMDGSADSYKGGQHHQGESEIMLLYVSSWDRVFIHYCADNLGWTGVPGVPMQDLRESNTISRKVFKVKAARLEFVLTDGQGNWDRAPNGCNYVVDKPGIFELFAGNLRSVSMA